jgi:putative glycosyltransferase (TIGR04372 family)
VTIAEFSKRKLQVLKALGLKRVMLLPVAAISVFLLFLLSKIITVKVHYIYNSRIGHFATNTELSYLTTKAPQNKFGLRPLHLFFFESKKSANLFLETLWRRKLTVLPQDLGWLIYDFAKRLPMSKIAAQSSVDDTNGLLVATEATLTFSSNEQTEGNRFLRKLGLSPNDKFVCLNVRDEVFLRQSEPIGWTKNRDWSYHNYRDSDISTYVQAAEALAEMGYTVFRMGALVKEPLVSKHPRVIDYAANGMRTEFLDIFLGAHCTFCISTGTGWDSVPTIFRRPIMFVNHLPIFGSSAITLPIMLYPKLLVDQRTLTAQSLTELIQKDLVTPSNTAAYADAGVEIRDLSSEELVEAVTEMAQRVEGTFVETPEQKEMQAKLKHILSTHPKLQPTPNYYPIRAEFASCFLSRYPNFLDGLD